VGATKLMVIRHAEKPGAYDGQNYFGVDTTAKKCSGDGADDLITIGWQRSGALGTLFVPPWGPKATLATPQFLFASDPAKTKEENAESAGNDSSEAAASKRPYETLTAMAGLLGSLGQPMTINTNHSKKHYADMVTEALTRDGPVLICWQHELIPLLSNKNKPGISQCILTQTGTPDNHFNIPKTWPDGARYDLIWVFDRASGEGQITGFSLFAQFLLAGDTAAPVF
jgi:hypothetical protein